MIDTILSKIYFYCGVYAFLSVFVVPVATYLLAYAVPKHIVTKYFRQPHFNDGDDQLFDLFPFRYYLTLWIAQLTACDWFARRRQAYDLRQDSPRYWRILAWIYFWLIVVPPLLSLMLSLLSLGYFEFTGREIPPA